MNAPDRRAPAALVAAGAAFALYAALRPYADESTPAGVAAVASAAWVVAHLLAVAAFVLLPVGLAAAGSRRAGLLAAAGAALVLPYYGAETFGLQAVAAQTLAAGGTAMPPLTDAIRFGAVQTVTFAAGLGLIAVAGVLVAVGLRRRGSGWAGVPLAVALVLVLPQFFGPPAVRIAHGMFVLIGCVLVARAVATAPTGGLTRIGARPGR